MTLVNSLGPLGWVILLSAPPLLILLYFLKLRRRPLEVPSTYLWQRAIADLHVNSLWQRLRRNLLLLLQILLVLLVVVTCLRPGWYGYSLQGERFIFMIDTSASMQATDTGTSRFDLALRRAGEMIEQMETDDEAMIISFSNRAATVQGYTRNKSELQTKLGKITPTNRTTDLREALLAASGLANPGRVSQSGTVDVQVADPRPATLYILSDGAVDSVEDFSLGNLRAQLIPLGSVEGVDNVGITSFSVEQNPDRLDQVQAFGRIENFGARDVQVEVELFLGDESRDVDRLTIAAGEFRGVDFDLSALADTQLQQARLRLQINRSDDFALDDVAYAVLNATRRARVLVISEGNDALDFALSTDEVQKIAEVETRPVAEMQSDQFKNRSQTGRYDLIIFDHCVPLVMPRCNTWFIGRVPPQVGWSGNPTVAPPVIIDVDQSHPLMQSVTLRKVLIVDATRLAFPEGGRVLIEADAGPLLAIAPREGFEDLVLGVPFFSEETDGRMRGNTDWLRSTSFPVFVHNVITYLGGGRKMLTTPNVQPGNSVTIRSIQPVESLQVQPPAGGPAAVRRRNTGDFVFGETSQLGVYDVTESDRTRVTQRFAVNLFSARESDIRPGTFSIGHEEIPAAAGSQPSRVEIWKWLLLAALIVLLVEWYIYHRRVYV